MHILHRVWGRCITDTYIGSGEEVSLVHTYLMEEVSLTHTYHIGSGKRYHWYAHTT